METNLQRQQRIDKKGQTDKCWFFPKVKTLSYVYFNSKILTELTTSLIRRAHPMGINYHLK